MWQVCKLRVSVRCAVRESLRHGSPFMHLAEHWEDSSDCSSNLSPETGACVSTSQARRSLQIAVDCLLFPGAQTPAFELIRAIAWGIFVPARSSCLNQNQEQPDSRSLRSSVKLATFFSDSSCFNHFCFFLFRTTLL